LQNYRDIKPQRVNDLCLYDLYAVVSHSGNLHGGHYISHAKHPVSKKWQTFNDSSVKDVKNPSEVINSQAYLLFYQQKTY
jgi:ubiquitin C-terminal hydrolase